MKPIDNFINAAAEAAEYFLSQMQDEDQRTIAALLAAGNGLSLSRVIHPDGNGLIIFEAVLSDGSRKPLAHVATQIPDCH